MKTGLRSFAVTLLCELTVNTVLALPIFTLFLLLFVPNDIPADLS